MIHAAATHSFEDIHMRGEPNVPLPQPFGIIHDDISIKISAISKGGWGNEWFNMNKETNKYNHKYSLMALSDVQTYRESETWLKQCIGAVSSLTSVIHVSKVHAASCMCAVRYDTFSSTVSFIQQKHQKQVGQPAHVKTFDSFAESRLLPTRALKELVLVKKKKKKKIFDEKTALWNGLFAL